MESNGRQAHIAAIDPERADLVTWAFTAYATGDHTLKSLAAELAARGLTVPATANMPERPISIQSLHRMLSNPFYTGQIVYRGGLYPGTHQALTDAQTFQRVQTILGSKVNGERTIRHPHYLKSTVYCGCQALGFVEGVLSGAGGCRLGFVDCLAGALVVGLVGVVWWWGV
ncbi:recombinase family protein, partial [Actinomyces oricola]|uniref:recombinase family protein n=1 Tax=Actinomyces oricola TaxID=206043 RepID=UPI0019D487C3